MSFTPAKAPAQARASDVMLAAVAAAVVLTAALLLAGCSSSRSFVPESSVTPGPLESNGPISWAEAVSRSGEVLSVQGPVAGTGGDGAGGVTLDVGTAAPDPTRFVVVIPEAVLGGFPKDPAAFYDGQLLTATGLIEDRGGTATMVVTTRKDLKTGL
jgi:hypothetical protein